MVEWLTGNWIAVALVLGMAIPVVWLLMATRRTTAIAREPGFEAAAETLARRNQALIDAPTASSAALAPAPAPAPAERTVDGADDLRRIKGIGPKVEALLLGLGVATYAQIAEWDDSAVERIDAQLGDFAGRIVRDEWRAQAALLAAGDIAAYEARFGKI